MGSINESYLNTEKQLFSSTSRAVGTYNTDVQQNWGYKGAHFILDITDSGGAFTLDVKIQLYDPFSQKYVDLTDGNFPQQNATGTKLLTIYPGIKETANVSVSEPLSKHWRVQAVVGSNAVTFSLMVAYVK